MLKLPKRFVENIASVVNILVQEVGENLEQIVLFGSCARGNITTGSDIDLLLITKSLIDTHKERGSIRDMIDDYNVDLVFYSKDRFEESDSLFVKNIKKDMICLWREGEFVEQL